MLNEAETRKQKIDQKLSEAGWSKEKGNLLEEYYISRTKLVRDAPEENPLLSPSSANQQSKHRNFADYILLGSDQKPLAILEAKRDQRSPLEGMEQAAEYAASLQETYQRQPFIFLSNGDEIHFWERGLYPPRPVQSFHTQRDLEDLLSLRLYSQPLHLFQPDPAIVDREYQQRAVLTVLDGLKQKRRKFLLVMATGTGKTRTVIALVALLFQAGWVNRVLFLADRRELVKQAMDAFELHYPGESRLRIEGGIIGEGVDARIHFATYPSMIQVLPRLSTGYYDLIIADESHRSIYKHYNRIFKHFDALQIGLTATPTDYIEHNTFEMFDCQKQRPTFEYPFEVAVENDYLVNFSVWDAKTQFQIEGIKGHELPPEFQKQIEEQGHDLEEINFEGSDLERRVTNTGTNDQLVDEFMQKCSKDARGLPHKSILFAVSHKHALELFESFNRRYPDLQARGMAKVIDSHMERAERTLMDFKTREMPRVAISVDMLDTGVDVPAIQTLVFAKPVYSQVKFWQMVGRGTRLWTDPLTGERKNDFLIIDHWDNFKTFERNPEGKVSYPDEPLPVRLFRIRLHKLALLRQQRDVAMAAETLRQLQTMVEQLPATNTQVRAHAPFIEPVRQDVTWLSQDLSSTGDIYRFIAPLMIFLPNLDTATLLFELHTEQLAVAHLEGQPEHTQRLQKQVQDDIARLPRNLSEVREKERMLTWAESPDFWTHLDLRRILELQRELVPVMRYRDARPRELIKLHLPDFMKKRRWITYGPGREGTFVEDYQGQVEANIKSLAEQIPTLARIKRRELPGAAEMEELAALLNKPDLFIREEILQQVYENPDMRLIDFMRHILEVQRLPSKKERIESAVEQFLQSHSHFSFVQRRFVYALQSLLLRRGEDPAYASLTLQHLMRAPFNRIGQVQDLFSAQELTELLQFANNQVA